MARRTLEPRSIQIGPTSIIGSIMWIAGWVLAQGFWSTFFAIFFPPWGWYLVIEAILLHFGLL